MKSSPNSCKRIIALSSKLPTPIPLLAPDPANPMKCSDPIFDANREAPTEKDYSTTKNF